VLTQMTMGRTSAQLTGNHLAPIQLGTQRRARVLIVDDADDARWVLARIVEQAGFHPLHASTGEQALTLIRDESPDLLLLDVHLPDMDGFEILAWLKKQEKSMPVIMITAYSKTYDATQAIRAGAYDFVTKPFNNQDIVLTMHQAIEDKISRKQPLALSPATSMKTTLLDTMGQSVIIKSLTQDVLQVAPTNFSVLILGETGTGKELVAQALHAESLRADQPFIVVDCGAIPATLIESELFGYEKGAFTGATQSKAGAFELANGGAIFLDEIGNLPLAMQSSLLRVLETRRVRRLGSVIERQVDFRLIAATNENLLQEVNNSSFRRDLYHRLAEFTITIPPLRERKEDLQFLVGRFIHTANQELNKQISDLSEEAWTMILRYDWPGNVRELRNQLRRAVLVSQSGETLITPKRFGLFDDEGVAVAKKSQAARDRACETECPMPGGVSSCFLVNIPLSVTYLRSTPLKEIVREASVQIERLALVRALDLTQGNKAKAARLLGVDYKTIQSKFNGYQITFNKVFTAAGDPKASAD